MAKKRKKPRSNNQSSLNDIEKLPMENDVVPEDVELLEQPQELPDISLEEQILSRFGNEQEDLEEASIPFNNNFADQIPEAVRDKIAAYLEEAIKKDKKNQQPWLNAVEKAKTLLGFKITDLENGNTPSYRKSNPSIGDSVQIKTCDTTFSSSVLRLWATLRSELLPTTGPVGFNTNVSVEEDYELKGEMVRDALNEYLTADDKGFYPDYDRIL